MPSIDGGGGGELPPLKSGVVGKTSSHVINSTSGGILFSNGVGGTENGVASTQDWVKGGGYESNNRGAFVRSGVSEYSISNNGYSKAKDLDTISTTSSVMSAAAAAAVAGTTVNGSGGGAANANVSNGVHMNGMQTLPHVRNGASGTLFSAVVKF